MGVVSEQCVFPSFLRTFHLTDFPYSGSSLINSGIYYKQTPLLDEVSTSAYLFSCLLTKYVTAREFIEDMLTFIILYNNLIPISLIVTMEVVKFQQAQLINSDLDMYYEKTDTPALCRTSSLVEELGQIEYVFSDKTGTLTRNEMEFRCCSIAGVAYADVVDEAKRADAEDGGKEGWRTFAELRTILEGGGGGAGNPFVGLSEKGEGAREKQVATEFMRLLAVCHTVIPEIKNEKINYQASSPDEAALVAGAELLGYQFHVSAWFHFFSSN